jgi:hypothetical protein
VRTQAKPIVENALTLSVSQLVRAFVIVPGETNSGTWYWSRPQRSEGNPYLLSAAYEGNAEEVEHSWLRLSYLRHGQSINLLVPLEATRPYYGGLRWWFHCPLNGSRVAKLYLPRGQLRFASRTAHGLTYRTCQESGRFAALHRLVASRLGVDEATIRALSKPPRGR